MLQRRIGQEDSQPRDSRSDRRCNSALLIRASDDDGARDSEEQSFFLGRQRTDAACRIQIANHYRKRFAVAMLALAQPHDG